MSTHSDVILVKGWPRDASSHFQLTSTSAQVHASCRGRFWQGFGWRPLSAGGCGRDATASENALSYHLGLAPRCQPKLCQSTKRTFAPRASRRGLFFGYSAVPLARSAALPNGRGADAFRRAYRVDPNLQVGALAFRWCPILLRLDLTRAALLVDPLTTPCRT